MPAHASVSVTAFLKYYLPNTSEHDIEIYHLQHAFLRCGSFTMRECVSERGNLACLSSPANN